MKAPQKQLKVHQHDGSAKVYFAPQLCLSMENNKQGLSKTHSGCIYTLAIIRCVHHLEFENHGFLLPFPNF
jgi:hypothetical protein